MELGLPGAAYIYQGEELGLFEVADIPWDRLEDPTAFHTAQATMDKGRDGCRVPLPWTAADEPALADFSRPAPADDGTGENHVPLCAAGQFGTGASFGFSPAVRADGVTPAADPHLPQPLCSRITRWTWSRPTRIRCTRCIMRRWRFVRSR